MCHENLVSATEANSKDYRQGGKVARKHAGGHRSGAHVHDHCGNEHLEKLETDGLCGGGEANADPVGEENAGTLPVAGLALVMYLELEHKPEDSRGYQPRERCGEGHAVHAHLGEPEEAFQKNDVQCRVTRDGERVAHEVPDGKSVRGDEGGKDGLQRAEGEPERDDAQELHRVLRGFFGETHPAGDGARKRVDDERECHPEQNAPEEDHGLRAVCVAGLLGADVLRHNARARLREGVEGGKECPEDGEHGAYACGCGFGSAREEPTVHHGLDHAHGEREDKRPGEAYQRTVFDVFFGSAHAAILEMGKGPRKSPIYK